MTSYSRAALLPAFAAALAFVACGDPGPEEASRGLDEATRARVVAVGDSAALSLVRTLGGELTARMAEDGPAGAVEFCAVEAQALTDSVSRALGPGWEVRRTTRQTRNPANAPDSLESEALEYFHARAEADSLPEAWVQRTPEGDYRYYTPLRLGAMCLACHGPVDDLDPAVRQAIAERYPEDQAVGYGQGDLRGVVRVTVPAEALE